jgi:hypothetical protein
MVEAHEDDVILSRPRYHKPAPTDFRSVFKALHMPPMPYNVGIEAILGDEGVSLEITKITPAVAVEEILSLKWSLQVHFNGARPTEWTPSQRSEMGVDVKGTVPMMTAQLRAMIEEAMGPLTIGIKLTIGNHEKTCTHDLRIMDWFEMAPRRKLARLLHPAPEEGWRVIEPRMPPDQYQRFAEQALQVNLKEQWHPTVLERMGHALSERDTG